MAATLVSARDILGKLTRFETGGLPGYEERFYRLLKDQSNQYLASLNTQLREARREIHERLALVNEGLMQAAFNEGTHLRIKGIQYQNVRPATGELFTSATGNVRTKDALTMAWRRTLRHAAAKREVIKRKVTGKRLTIHPHGLDMPRLAKVPARKHRAAFATMAGWLGAPDRLLKAYPGHSSGDILGGHYRRIDLDELRAVSTLMNDWRGAIPKSDFGKNLATRQTASI
ncbi:MAG: hypothetical protein M1457_07800 [bacterium]|nr:hypothetical protein [bacterium]